jgi:hypothetical protein
MREKQEIRESAFEAYFIVEARGVTA